jgi:hypothetical protein
LPAWKGREALGAELLRPLAEWNPRKSVGEPEEPSEETPGNALELG